MDRNEKVQDYKCSAQNAVNRDSDVFIAQAQKKQLGDFFMQKQKKTHRQKCRIEYQPLKLTKRCLNSSVYTFEVDNGGISGCKNSSVVESQELFEALEFGR